MRWSRALNPMALIVTGYRNSLLHQAQPGGVHIALVLAASIAVFIAGLMVGRTPEYLGKKIESFEMKMAMLAVLVLAADLLLLTGAASVPPAESRPAGRLIPAWIGVGNTNLF